MEIEQMLDELDDLQGTIEKINQQRNDLIDSVIPTEIKMEIERINQETVIPQTVTDRVVALRDQITAAVLEKGATVAGKALMAVYSRGRVAWDTKALDGFMLALPELAKFKSEGKPSVSIRRRN